MIDSVSTTTALHVVEAWLDARLREVRAALAGAECGDRHERPDAPADREARWAVTWPVLDRDVPTAEVHVPECWVPTRKAQSGLTADQVRDLIQARGARVHPCPVCAEGAP